MTDSAYEVSMWTIYDHPLDYPEFFVAVRNTIPGGIRREVLTAATLDEVRYKMMGRTSIFLHRMERDPEDDPVIVETWI